MTDSNPYQPPTAEVVDRVRPWQVRLASRWLRLVAAILDGILGLIASLLLAIPAFLFLEDLEKSPQLLTWTASLAFLLVYAAINGYLLATQGQSIGKRVLNIRIVRLDGRLGSLWRVFGVRFLLPSLACMLAYSLALAVGVTDPDSWFDPAGNLVWLADVLLIFGASRRCLHDYLAGTIVIQA